MTEDLGIKHLRLVLGRSIGALQAFHRGAVFPEMMDLLAPFCGSARCSRHNFMFLEGVKAALTADAVFKEGWYDEKSNKRLRAAACVYAGWGFSQMFYRQKLDLERMGYSSLEDFLVSFWEGFFLPKDPNDLLTVLWAAARRSERQRDLQGQFRGSAWRDQGQDLRHPRQDRPLFSHRRQ